VRRRRPGDGDDRRAARLSEILPDQAALERVAREVAAEWGVELGDPFELARYSFVAPAGEGAVLKVVPPEEDESSEEAEALELWAGEGAVRLLRHDRARRALLLERGEEDISGLDDVEATGIAIATGLKLWRPASAPFRWVGDHVPRWLETASGPELGPLARELYASLDVSRETLVHGDFHHHNILRSARGPLAIDPKPMLGEPEYDVPSFLWNPLWHRMSRDVTERRLAAFAAAGLDDERMRKWTVIRGAYLRPDQAEELLTLV
jgi:streptomycin 6-kinase